MPNWTPDEFARYEAIRKHAALAKELDAFLLKSYTPIRGQLVRAEELMNQVFAPECKPSLRWLRTQTKPKAIPHIRIGRLVFSGNIAFRRRNFDVEMVRAALASNRLVCRKTGCGF